MGKPCPPGCTCKRHSNGGKKCVPGCNCGLHTKAQADLDKMNEGRRLAIEAGRKVGKWLDGRSHHPHHGRWYAMVRRCCTPEDTNYHSYGGRGITVCDQWLTDPFSFYRYLDEVLGPCPDHHSLDRIDVDGNYEPGNVRWASREEQRRNQRPRPPKPKKLRLYHPEPNVWVIR